MNELHRLTLRQINENPTLMSDEVFVPEEEVAELERELANARIEAEEDDMTRGRMRDILVATANALKGEPGELRSHSWHDLAEVAKKLREGLQDPDTVHVAMLRGTIAMISMRQCAHLHGDKMMEAFNRWDELRGDLKMVSDVLMDFPGATVWQQAQHAVKYIEWLKMELKISQYNERATLDALAQNNRHLHGGGGYDEGEARQASRPAGAKQERASDEEGGGPAAPGR